MPESYEQIEVNPTSRNDTWGQNKMYSDKGPPNFMCMWSDGQVFFYLEEIASMLSCVSL